MPDSAAFAGILGISLILSVGVYVFGRLRIEQERTLHKLIDRGMSGEELLRSAGLAGQSSKDLRRGLLLVALGLSWSTVTFFVGGTAWMAGIVPVAIGLTLLLFRFLDGRMR
jgi:hypothetical protein